MGFGSMFGKVVGWGTGITPTKKLFGLNPHDLPPEAYDNPFFAKDRAKDQKRSNFYDNQSKDAFGDLSRQGNLMNAQGRGYNPLINKLTNMQNGVGPSLAQMQLQQGTNRNIQNQAGIAASNPGMNPAMAQRMMGQNVAGLNQEAAGQAGQLRLQEQMDAIGQLLAARQAQGQTYGMAGNMMQNRANMGMSGGMNYQNMAQMLAEQERAAQMARASGNQSAYEGAMGRRLGFLSKAGSAVAGAMGGGAAAGGASGSTALTTPDYASWYSNKYA